MRPSEATPDPGRTATFPSPEPDGVPERGARSCWTLDIDVTAILPRDDSAFGFDNVNAGDLSPTLMERYLAAARRVSRLAVGSDLPAPGSRVVVVPADRTQEDHVAGLPFGTRGGTAVDHTFPADGEYEIQVRLQRNRNENVEGLTEPHDVEITLDGERLGLFTMEPSRELRHAGQRRVLRGRGHRQPPERPHPGAGGAARGGRDVHQEELRAHRDDAAALRRPLQHGSPSPAAAGGAVGVHRGSVRSDRGGRDAEPRPRLFVPAGRPDASDVEAEECATAIIAGLARRAYRRPVTVDDLDQLVSFYRRGYAAGGFESGIETGLRALLASPEFLFRIERDPAGVAPGAPYRVSDLELASRLSFFLWSSLPDDELIDVAAARRLSDPAVLRAQVRRMLADPRAETLTTNFASQWLHLRNLDAVRPDARLFPDFDDNLRQSFRRETELLFQSVLEEDRSVVDLLTAEYTFVNERVARHYGFPGVYGDHFRRVDLPEGSPRAGLLGHGSILTVTSYATRTSPVLRGKWILENLLGTPPPAPPANVPPLDETRSNTRIVSMRERMEAHRQNPQCAVCHRIMDPAGLSMENFDAIGRWRDAEGGAAIDAAGNLPGGEDFDGVAGLREAVLDRPAVFVGTVAEKLLIYALGRGLDHADAPALRAITRAAAADDYRLSSLILGIVESTPFQMRRSQS